MKTPINHITHDAVEEFERYALFQGPNLMERYQLLAVRNSAYPGKGSPFGLLYVALGLAEAGEVQGKVKKAFRDDGIVELAITDTPYGEATMVEFQPLPAERQSQIAKELGGLLWYLCAVCSEAGLSLSEVAIANLKQLADRTERGTLQGDGDDR